MDRNQVLAVAIVILALLVGAFLYDVVTTDTLAPSHPQAILDFEHHSANESVTVIHRKGETYDRQNTKALEVYVFPATETRPASPSSTIGLPFTEGDAVTLPNVSDDDRVVILWQGASNTHIIGNYSVRNGES